MAKRTIPNAEGQIRQVNRGDIFGELWETKNIDLTTSPGKIKTSQRLARVLDNTDLESASGVVKILIWNNKYYVATADEVFECPVTQDPRIDTNWSKASSLNDDLDPASDVVIFDDKFLFSWNTDIGRWNGSVSSLNTWWTTEADGTDNPGVYGSALTTQFPHIMHVHRSGQETLFVTDKNKIRYFNTKAGHSTITLQTDLVANSVDSGVDAVWVGTHTETGENALVYEVYVGEQIDSVPVARNAYPIQGRAVLALWVMDNTPYIVTDRGYIQKFNGVGFTTVAEFPFVMQGRQLDGVRAGQVQDSSLGRPIHPNGVAVHGSSVYILLNSDAEEDSNSVSPRTHSGVWEFNKDTNVLNHRFSLADSATDYGVSRLTASGALLVVDNQYTYLLVGGDIELQVGLYATTTGANTSWFVTPEYYSVSPQDAYNEVLHKAKTMTSGEMITTFYRTSKKDTVYGTANWTGTDVFVTTDDFSTVEVGDLVRVETGYASGDYANVVSIESSATTYTITVDRDIGSNTQSSVVYVDNFIKIDDEYDSTDGEMKRVGINVEAPWIQFMVILKGEIEYRQFIADPTPKEGI